MKILTGILILIVVLQAILLWNYQRQIKDICRQLSFLMEQESNMIITTDIRYGNLGKLADILNKWLEKKREEKREYLKKEKNISETYTSLSHDIRTPLTSLDGYFQLLETSRDAEEQKKYILVIQERISSLKEMLEELFTFTKLQNDAFQMELAPCCINQILKSTIFSYYDEWTARGIEPEISLTEERLFLEGNEPAIRRVMQNMIKNGLDHGEKNISIQLEKEEEEIVIRVKNHVNEPEKIKIDQVFERFYKADEARSRTSSGLGLSIAKELVLRMNGTIAAFVEGEQFCVEVRFPEESMKSI